MSSPIPIELFEPDHRPILTIGKSFKSNQPIRVIFKNGVPHLLVTRLIRGSPSSFAIEEPYNYLRVKSRQNSDFHEKFMYLQQAKLELYQNVVMVEETTHREFNVLKFTLDDDTVKYHIVQIYKAKNDNDREYRTVSIHPWEC